MRHDTDRCTYTYTYQSQISNLLHGDPALFCAKIWPYIYISFVSAVYNLYVWLQAPTPTPQPTRPRLRHHGHATADCVAHLPSQGTCLAITRLHSDSVDCGGHCTTVLFTAVRRVLLLVHQYYPLPLSIAVVQIAWYVDILLWRIWKETKTRAKAKEKEKEEGQYNT